MSELKYVFGPVPSRRMGRSLGISPIPKKTCNYSCVYCQLGRTNKMTNKREEYFLLEDILSEFDSHHDEDSYDVITIVGEGEPTLYSRLGELIVEIKKRSKKPVAVITNGALLYDKNVRSELMNADIVLPSLDSYNEEMFKRIDRPYGRIKFDEVWEGLVDFTNEYKGQIYMEIMLMNGVNDDEKSLLEFKKLLEQIKYDRLYINTPVRPPAEEYIEESSKESIQKAVEILKGVSIDMLSSVGFSSDIEDDYQAVISIIGRHPMNQFEIRSFLESRENKDIDKLMQQLSEDDKVQKMDYKGYCTYRLK